jgi:hypothetical protein
VGEIEGDQPGGGDRGGSGEVEVTAITTLQ